MGDIGSAVALAAHTNGVNGVAKAPRPQFLNIGVIGIGRMGQIHALNILRLIPRARLVCGCSPAQADLEWGQANLVPHGVAVYATVDELLRHPGLDAVVIASITELHYTHTKQALQAGIHVLCEKPISQTIDQLRDLYAIAQTNPKVRCMVGFTRRFDENYQDAVQKIREGAIGSPVVIRSQGCEKLDDGPFMHKYVSDAARGGGFFVDSFIHDIDLTLSFLEADGHVPVPKSVCAMGTAAIFKELEDPSLADADNAVGMIQFWGGQISYHYNSRTAAAGYDNQTEIFGTRGKISVNLVSKLNRLEVSDANGVHVAALPSWYNRYKPSFVTELIAFTDAVLDEKPMPISLESCLTSLLIAQSLQESMRTGRRIDFDEQGRPL